MRVLPAVTELKIVSVEDPGVPNKERVVLQVVIPVNIADFALVIGAVRPEGGIVPLPDQFFWMGERMVYPGTWIVVMTGRGEFQQTKTADNKDVLWLYWNKAVTVLGTPNIGVGLFKLAGLNIVFPSSPKT